MTTAQVASYYALRPSTVRRAIRRGRLRAIKNGARWSADLSDVQDWRRRIERRRAAVIERRREKIAGVFSMLIGKGQPEELCLRWLRRGQLRKLGLDPAWADLWEVPNKETVDAQSEA